MGAAGKRCACGASQHIAEWPHGDLRTPFEICWYCQSSIIRSGSRWASYCCDACRPRIHALNNELDASGLISLPVGRHSLMHTHWRHARPFTAPRVAAECKQRRLRQAWSLWASASADWARFAACMRNMLDRTAALQHIVLLVQQSGDDCLIRALRRANARLHRPDRRPA